MAVLLHDQVDFTLTTLVILINQFESLFKQVIKGQLFHLVSDIFTAVVTVLSAQVPDLPVMCSGQRVWGCRPQSVPRVILCVNV